MIFIIFPNFMNFIYKSGYGIFKKLQIECKVTDLNVSCEFFLPNPSRRLLPLGRGKNTCSYDTKMHFCHLSPWRCNATANPLSRNRDCWCNRPFDCSTFELCGCQNRGHTVVGQILSRSGGQVYHNHA